MLPGALGIKRDPWVHSQMHVYVSIVYYSDINMIEMWVLTSCHNSNPFPCPGFLGLGEQRWMVRFGWLSRTPDLESQIKPILSRSCPDVPVQSWCSCCSSVAFEMICGTCGMCGFLWQDFVQVSKRCAFLKQFGPTWQCSVLRGHFTNDVEKGRAKKDCQATRLSLQLAAACGLTFASHLKDPWSLWSV